LSKVKCFNCNTYGHFANDYCKPNRRAKVNLVTHKEDDEPMLLMADVCKLATIPSSKEEVLLHEDKVVPKIKGT
jgi:hypothetical protein